MMQSDWWDGLCDAVRRKLELPDATELPTAADVAAAWGESWIAPALDVFDERLHALIDARLGPATDDIPAGAVRIPPELFSELPDGNLAGPVFDTQTGRLVFSTAEDFALIHGLWESVRQGNPGTVKHPLAPLAEAWLTSPPAKTDKRKTGILPATLATVREANAAALFDLRDYENAPGFVPHPIGQAYLPGLAPVRNQIAPPFPLVMWDASNEGGENSGKGAPLALRIWIEAVLSLPTDERFGRRIVHVEYRDLIEWLMPNGRYQRSSFPAIRRALNRVHNLRMPWELPDGTGGSRAVVVVRDAPRVWDALEDRVTFDIMLPPGVNGRGPIVYRPALRTLGQQSAMRYRAKLGLSWLWDRYGATGGRYIQPERPRLARDNQDRILDAEGEILTGNDGEPVRTYTVQRKRNGELLRVARPGIVPLDADGRPVPTLADAAKERNPAADRYPVLSPDQLAELCYPLDLDGERLTPAANRKRQERAVKAIQSMAEGNYCIVEDLQGGVRILPPSGWGAGYSG